MKRKITTILLAMLLVVGTAIGLCSCANQEDIDNAVLPVEQQVTLINTTLDDMKATDKTLNDSITALTGRVTTLEGELETAKNNIGSVSSALTQEIADRKADIKTLQDKDTELKAQITALETALSNKEQGIKDWANGAFVTVTDWTAFKNKIDATIAGLTSRIETLESSVGKINSTLDDMKATDKTLNESIAGLTGRVTTLETELDEVNTKITSLQTNSATKEQLENVKKALEDQINSLNGEIAKLKAKDTDLQGQITALQNSLTSEIDNVEDWANDTFLSIENWNTAKAKIEGDIQNLTDRVDDIDNTLKVVDTTIEALKTQVEQNRKEIEDLTIRVNCLEGKHVADTTEAITYTWSNDFSTCTASGTCMHCGATVSETADSTILGYTLSVSFAKGFSVQTIDLTDLTDMDSDLQAKALSFIFAAKPTTLTLTLPKDFNSFNLINDPITNYDDGKYIDLTLKCVETIAKWAFSSNSHLKSICLPDVTEIGGSAFQKCINLTDISVGKVKKLDSAAFLGCVLLREIELPRVTSIGTGAFCNTYIERIKFGSVITEIELAPFTNVDTTKCILIFAEGQKKFVGSDKDRWEESDEAMTSDDTEFVGNTFKRIVVGDIPECTAHDIEVVYKWSDDFTSCTAVSECKNCFRILADETVSGDKISLEGFVYTATFENALFGTTMLDLTDLTNFNEYQYQEILTLIFSEKLADITLILPLDFDYFYTVKSLIDRNYEDGTLNLTLKGVEKIPNEAFIMLSELKSIHLADAIEIGDNAFQSCTELTEVTANNVTKIGSQAFLSCYSLTELNFPKATEIETNAFEMCIWLKEIKFGSAITKIETNAFKGCYSIVKIEFGGIITEIGADAFKDVDTENCTLTLAKGQKNFTKADDGSFTITENDVVAETNADFCGYTFKEIKFAEE